MSAPFEPSASDLPPLPAQVHEPFLNASHGPWIESPVRAPIWRPGDLPAIPFGGSSDEQDGSLFPGAWPGRGPGSDQADFRSPVRRQRSEEHTSELQSLMRISYAVFCLKKKTRIKYLE